MDELQFLGLLKVLLSSVLVSPSSSPSFPDVDGFDSSSGSTLIKSPSCLSEEEENKSIRDLLKSKAFIDFLDSSSCTSSLYKKQEEDISFRDVPLSCEWSFWNSSYDRNSTAKGLQKNKYLSYVHKTLSFTTFGKFIDAWQQTLVSELPVSTSLSIFRQNIPPVWEAPENREGGKFAFACGSGQEDAIQLFFVLTSAIITGKVGLPGDVCGIVVSFREWGGTIAVWNSNSSDEGQLKRIEFSLSQFSSHHICYQPHRVSMQINKYHIKSKYRKPKAQPQPLQHYTQYPQHPQQPQLHLQSNYSQYPQHPHQRYPPQAHHFVQTHPYTYQHPQPLPHYPIPQYHYQRHHPHSQHPQRQAQHHPQHRQHAPARTEGRVLIPTRILSYEPLGCDIRAMQPAATLPPPPPGFSFHLNEEPKDTEDPIADDSIESEVNVGEVADVQKEQEKEMEIEEQEVILERLEEEKKQEEEVPVAALPIATVEEPLDERVPNCDEEVQEDSREEEEKPKEEEEKEEQPIIATEQQSVSKQQHQRNHDKKKKQAKKKKNGGAALEITTKNNNKKHRHQRKGSINCGILAAPVMNKVDGFMTERLRFIVLNVSVIAILFFSLFSILF